MYGNACVINMTRVVQRGTLQMKVACLFTVACASVIAGCATRLETHSDHGPKQNFARYHTFAWMAEQPMIAPPGDVAQASPLNRRRIEMAIESELAHKGFMRVEARGTADFVVSYTVG